MKEKSLHESIFGPEEEDVPDLTGYIARKEKEYEALMQHLLYELDKIAKRGFEEKREYGVKLCQHPKTGETKLGSIVRGEERGVDIGLSVCGEPYREIAGYIHTHPDSETVESPILPGAHDISMFEPGKIHCITASDGWKSRVTCYTTKHDADTFKEMSNKATASFRMYEAVAREFSRKADDLKRRLPELNRRKGDALFEELERLYGESSKAYKMMMTTLEEIGDNLRCYDKVV